MTVTIEVNDCLKLERGREGQRSATENRTSISEGCREGCREGQQGIEQDTPGRGEQGESVFNRWRRREAGIKNGISILTQLSENYPLDKGQNFHNSERAEPTRKRHKALVSDRLMVPGRA